MNSVRSTEEWEQLVGQHVREARFQADLTMRELAEQADVSLGAVHNLEHGRGATVRTLVRVVRALGRTDWLETLAPEVAVSPMQLLRDQQRQPPERRRVRHPAG